MSVFDIGVLAVVVILTLTGLWKGMVRQLFGLGGLVAGYVLAMKYYGAMFKVLGAVFSWYRQGTQFHRHFSCLYIHCPPHCMGH